MKKFNARGFAHWIMPMAAVLIISSIGGYIYLRSSSATTLGPNQETCTLLGRSYNATTSTCAKICVSGAGTLTVASTYDYCTGAITRSISSTTCTNTYHRKYVAATGCARYWQQAGVAGGRTGVLQCIGNSLLPVQTSDGSSIYHWTTTNDYCDIGFSSATNYGTSPQYVEAILARHSSKYHSGNLGNANTAASNLGSIYGYTVNHRPAVNATVSFAQPYVPSPYGHVAIVAAVYSNGTILVDESSWAGIGKYGEHVVSASIVPNLTYAHTEVGWHY